MKEYWTISKPPIPEDDEESLLQFFRNGQVGAEYWLPAVICPQCNGEGHVDFFPFPCPERLKTHPAIANGVPIPLDEYKKLVPLVRAEPVI